LFKKGSNFYGGFNRFIYWVFYLTISKLSGAAPYFIFRTFLVVILLPNWVKWQSGSGRAGGWGAAWGMSGVKFATVCYWVTPRGVGPCYSPRMNSQLP